MARARTELIHCDNCGEDYAATYRRCPFCDAKPGRRETPAEDREDVYEDDYYDEEPARRRGGKRLAGGGRPPRRGGDGQWWRIALYLLSALVILAAIWIVTTKFLPKLLPDATPSPSQSQTAQPQPSPVAPSVAPTTAPSQDLPEPSPADPAGTGDDPLSLDSPDLPSVEPDPLASAAPPVSSAAPGGSLALSSTDFTMSPRYPTYQMEIAGVGRGQATYRIQDETVASVNSTGLITALSNGTTTLTVTDKNGNSATAVVRVSGMGAAGQSTPAPSAQPSQAPSAAAPAGSAKLNYTDFSITAAYPDPVRLRVQGGEASAWRSSNESVAAVSSNGTVSGAGNGYAKITCTLTDGSTLTCDVHVSGK